MYTSKKNIILLVRSIALEFVGQITSKFNSSLTDSIEFHTFKNSNIHL